MSNVRYQQALHQAHAMVQKYMREREEFMRKEVIAASLQAELEAVQTANNQLMAILKKRIIDLPTAKQKNTSTSAEPRPDVTTSSADNKKDSIPAKVLHQRTESENNSTSYLSVASKILKVKPTKPAPVATQKPVVQSQKPVVQAKDKPKPKPIIVYEDPEPIIDSANNTSECDMSIDYGSEDDEPIKPKPTESAKNEPSKTQPSKSEPSKTEPSKTSKSKKDKQASSKRKQEKQPKKVHDQQPAVAAKPPAAPEVDQASTKESSSLRRSSRSTTAVGTFAEPSLRDKMRRGGPQSNIVPEYVVRSYLLPSKSQGLIADDEDND